jgi:hypothetical protein
MKEIETWLSNFNMEVFVEHEGKKYTLKQDDIKSIYSTMKYWHSITDPGTWLCDGIVKLAEKKLDLPENKIILLCSKLLNITPEKLKKALKWNTDYINWHDGLHPE